MDLKTKIQDTAESLVKQTDKLEEVEERVDDLEIQQTELEKT